MSNKNIVDMHNHIFPQKIATRAVSSIGTFYNTPMAGQGIAEDLIQSGNKAGISHYVISSAATTPAQVPVINDFIARLSKRNKCFIGFGTIHPDFEDPEAEIEIIINNGLKGVKLHPDLQKIYIDNSAMFPIYEMLEEKGLPVIFHIGDNLVDFSNPTRLAKVLEFFPRLKVVAAHLGGYGIWDDRLGDILQGRDVYYDTSSSLMFLDKDQAVQRIRSHGIDKVLYGTDYPMWSHESEMKKFLALGLNDEEIEKILWKNPARLLGLPTNSKTQGDKTQGDGSPVSCPPAIRRTG